ncbi:MAG: hypothetical protein U0R44_01750 [Candidatus Micrarchaeia archaeon]
MGRNIPSITYRIDEKLREWERFGDLLPPADRRAFRKLITVVRDRRTAIDAADECIEIAMLLAIAIHLKASGGGSDDERGPDSREDPQGRIAGP